MESLNDLIWNEEDDDVVDVTEDSLTYVVCLLGCIYEAVGGLCDGGPPYSSSLAC